MPYLICEEVPYEGTDVISVETYEELKKEILKRFSDLDSITIYEYSRTLDEFAILEEARNEKNA